MPSTKPFLSFLFGSLLDNSGRAATAGGPTLSQPTTSNSSKSTSPIPTSSAQSVPAPSTRHHSYSSSKIASVSKAYNSSLDASGGGGNANNYSNTKNTNGHGTCSLSSSLTSSDYFYQPEPASGYQFPANSVNGFTSYNNNGSNNNLSSQSDFYSNSPAFGPEPLTYLNQDQRNNFGSISNNNISSINTANVNSSSSSFSSGSINNYTNTNTNALNTSPGSSFYPSSPAEKWWIGGRTLDGREKYYRLEPLRRRSFDRVSLDRISI